MNHLPAQPPLRPGRRHRMRLSLAAVVAVALMTAGWGLATVTANAPTATATPADPAPSVPKIVADVSPSVVTVLTDRGIGSGVIYRAAGVILTNHHVVGDATTVEVEFADGRRDTGTVTATDPDTDLALIHVNRSDLPAARFDTRLPAIGAQALALGSPLGFEKSVTAGIISGLHRSIPGSARDSAALVDLMQTDAPVSPGNSGGALVDGQGHVNAIVDAYIPPAQGAVAIGFAIPGATAVSVADQLLKTGRVEHAFIGVQPAQLTPALASQLGIQAQTGVLVYGVSRDGPASQAGIRPGDVLLTIGGKPVETVEDLYARLRENQPGDTITLGLARDYDTHQAHVTLSAKPQ
jgi:serine protease DegQ